MVLLGALFRLTSIKLICGQQNSQLGNNWATKVIVATENTTQRKENMLFGVECVCPYHKQ